MDSDEKQYLKDVIENSKALRIFKIIKSEVGEDLGCIKYVLTHCGSIGGSTIRLARMCRMMYFTTLFLCFVILVWRFVL